MSESQRFVDLGRPRRIWAVGAVHGTLAPLAALHDEISGRFQPGDRLVYLGNLIGRGPDVARILDEVLMFRRAMMALPGVMAHDIVFLRGCQEEMWHKLLQLQFCPTPKDVLTWMARQGVDATLAAYGASAQQGLTVARDGVMALTRWTNGLRATMRAKPGHEALFAALRRAAYTFAPGGQNRPGVLLVSAGLDVNRSLPDQGDALWWGASPFDTIDEPYNGFNRIVRGFDPNAGGILPSALTLTLDGGCGRGGTLAAALLSPSGEILDILEA